MDTTPTTPIFIRILCSISLLNQYRYMHESGGDTDATTRILQSDICYYFSQLSSRATLNYYPRTSPLCSQYPDDIDDTFSALYIIANYDKELITPELLARILASLDDVRSASDPILFNTWYNNTSQFASTDIVALSAVVAFFDQTYFPCSDLKRYVFDSYILRLNDLTLAPSNFSEFYHSLYLPLYLISRITWTQKQYFTLFEHIATLLDVHRSNPPQSITDRYLLICTSCKLLGNYLDLYYRNQEYQHSFHGEIAALMSLIRDTYNTCDESMPSSTDLNKDALYIERIHTDRVEYAYSGTFSTYLREEVRIAVEHIQTTYEKITLAHNTHDNRGLINNATTGMTSDTLIEFLALELLTPEFEHSPAEQKTYITKTITELALSTDFRIVRDILYIRLRNHIDQPFEHDELSTDNYIETLVTHLAGLLGYYLYDKIIDTDIDTTYTAISSFAMREYKKRIMHSYISSGPQILHTIDQILSDIDIQLQLEIQRLPYNIHDTARKSLGTAIVPIVLFPMSEKIILDFFRSFQMIRQVCDDFKDHDIDKLKNKYTTLDLFKTQNNVVDVAQIETTIISEFGNIRTIISSATSTDRSNDYRPQNTLTALLLDYTQKLEQKINKLFFEIKTLDHATKIHALTHKKRAVMDTD